MCEWEGVGRVVLDEVLMAAAQALPFKAAAAPVALSMLTEATA